VIHETTDTSGGMTLIDFGAFTGSARGLLSGTTYRAVNVQLDNQTRNGSLGATESTDEFDIHFAAQSSSQQSFYSHVTYHFTFNVNGDVTAETLNVRIECR
jgi:hypothetical protein